MSGPVGFAETISTWTRSGVSAEPPSEALAGFEDLVQRRHHPGVRHVQVHESGACRLRFVDEPARHCLDRDLRREIPRCQPPRGRDPERDVRRVVAVLRIPGALELHRRAGNLGERLPKARQGT